MEYKKIYIYLSDHHGKYMEIRYEENEVGHEWLPINFPFKINENIEEFTVNLCLIDYESEGYLKILSDKDFNNYNEANNFSYLLDSQFHICFNLFKKLSYIDIDEEDIEGELFTVIVNNKDKSIVNYNLIYI